MAAQLESWALPRLQQLLPLDDQSLRHIITYSNSLSTDRAADHLQNLLGNDAQSLEFISSFNLRRQHPSPITNTSTPPTPGTPFSEAPRRPRPQTKKKKAQIHALPARQVEGHGNVSGAYRKRDEGDYMAGPSRQRHTDHVAENLALQSRLPDRTPMPLITDDAPTPPHLPVTAKPPPSASGPLISDSLSPRGNTQTATSARKSSPALKAKINISGGTAMHGASTALSDLDSAIRSLEIQTNPALNTTAADDARRKCKCMASRHPLLDMAPNCLNCGKVICVKEGLGPCTFCKSPLLSPDELQKVLRVLIDERGEERMKSNNTAARKRADVAHGKTRAFTGRDFLAQTSSARSSPLSSAPATPASSDDEATVKAKAHRDRLLAFQANNARRTQIHDEAADFDVPSAGTNMWASPQERAQQLKKQQKMLREMEWNAKPEFEKRTVVASIDVQAGRVVRRMAEVEKPDFTATSETDARDDDAAPVSNGAGAFTNNPLAKGLIRPTAREGPGVRGGEEEEEEEEKTKTKTKKQATWRRVQMDHDDNEAWILDGGVYGSKCPDVPLSGDEHACS